MGYVSVGLVVPHVRERVTWKRMEIGVDVEWSGVHVVLGMLWERRGTAGAPLDSTRSEDLIARIKRVARVWQVWDMHLAKWVCVMVRVQKLRSDFRDICAISGEASCDGR